MDEMKTAGGGAKTADAAVKAAERRKRLRMMAKRIATQDGQDWSAISKESKKVFVNQARERLKARRAERAGQAKKKR